MNNKLKRAFENEQVTKVSSGDIFFLILFILLFVFLSGFLYEMMSSFFLAKQNVIVFPQFFLLLSYFLLLLKEIEFFELLDRLFKQEVCHNQKSGIKSIFINFFHLQVSNYMSPGLSLYMFGL